MRLFCLHDVDHVVMFEMDFNEILGEFFNDAKNGDRISTNLSSIFKYQGKYIPIVYFTCQTIDDQGISGSGS